MLGTPSDITFLKHLSASSQCLLQANNSQAPQSLLPLVSPCQKVEASLRHVSQAPSTSFPQYRPEATQCLLMKPLIKSPQCLPPVRGLYNKLAPDHLLEVPHRSERLLWGLSASLKPLGCLLEGILSSFKQFPVVPSRYLYALQDHWSQLLLQPFHARHDTPILGFGVDHNNLVCVISTDQ
jgi:hypothetical protein